MPPLAIRSRVVVTISCAFAACASSPPGSAMRPIRNSSAEAGGNLGAPPKPPKFGSNWAARFCSASSSTPGDGLSSGARTCAGALSPSTVRGADVADLVAAGAPRLGDALQHLAEARHPVAGLGREVRAAVERHALGIDEHVQRPAALAGHRLHRSHVDRVHVGALLAVDLHRDEVLVHDRGRLGVLEGLVLHHVAPVAGGVADRDEQRLVLRPRARERLLAPRVPVDGVVLVLEEVGAGLVGEPVRHSRANYPSGPTRTPRMPPGTGRGARRCGPPTASIPPRPPAS